MRDVPYELEATPFVPDLRPGALPETRRKDVPLPRVQLPAGDDRTLTLVAPLTDCADRGRVRLRRRGRQVYRRGSCGLDRGRRARRAGLGDRTGAPCGCAFVMRPHMMSQSWNTSRSASR